jgi:septum formation inhibitor-activating ATPase MinD
VLYLASNSKPSISFTTKEIREDKDNKFDSVFSDNKLWLPADKAILKEDVKEILNSFEKRIEHLICDCPTGGNCERCNLLELIQSKKVKYKLRS